MQDTWNAALKSGSVYVESKTVSMPSAHEIMSEDPLYQDNFGVIDKLDVQVESIINNRGLMDTLLRYVDGFFGRIL